MSMHRNVMRIYIVCIYIYIAIYNVFSCLFFLYIVIPFSFFLFFFVNVSIRAKQRRKTVHGSRTRVIKIIPSRSLFIFNFREGNFHGLRISLDVSYSIHGFLSLLSILSINFIAYFSRHSNIFLSNKNFHSSFLSYIVIITKEYFQVYQLSAKTNGNETINERVDNC